MAQARARSVPIAHVRVAFQKGRARVPSVGPANHRTRHVRGERVHDGLVVLKTELVTCHRPGPRSDGAIGCCVDADATTRAWTPSSQRMPVGRASDMAGGPPSGPSVPRQTAAGALRGRIQPESGASRALLLAPLAALPRDASISASAPTSPPLEPRRRRRRPLARRPRTRLSKRSGHPASSGSIDAWTPLTFVLVGREERARLPC